MIKKKLLLTFTLIAIAISGFSQTAEEYYDRAVEKCTWENYRGAIKDLNKSIDLKPSLDAYILRGMAKMKKGNSDAYAAIKDFDKAIFVNDSSDKSLLNRGIAHLQVGNYQKAEQDFTRVIELNPNRMSGYKGRVKARRGLNDLAGANADAKVIESLRGGEKIAVNGTMSSEEVTDAKDESGKTEDDSKVVSMDSFNGMEVRKTIEIDMRDFVPAQKEINLAGQQLLNARRTFVVGFLLNIGG
jgi:tetratricopeptide (TPR) repeat protein